jgi:hypothetical protein
MTALVRSLQISEKKTIDAVLPSRFCIRQSGRHRPQTDSLITDSQKGYFSFDNVVTLVANLSIGINILFCWDIIPNAEDKWWQCASTSQLEKLQEEGSYRITVRRVVLLSKEGMILVTDIPRVPTLAKMTSTMKIVKNAQIVRSRNGGKVQSCTINDSLFKIMKESSEAAASLPVVPQSTGGSSKMSQMRSFPLEPSLRSLSVCSLDDMDLERSTRCTVLA